MSLWTDQPLRRLIQAEDELIHEEGKREERKKWLFLKMTKVDKHTSGQQIRRIGKQYQQLMNS